MRNILCFGDSNTFGVIPTGGRYPIDVRWPGRLQTLLGEEYHIIEEGMGGRTTVFQDPFEPGRCGAEILPVLLSSHKPLDLVIISLGANDCKRIFNATPRIVAKGIEKLCEIVKEFDYGGNPAPQLLVMSPAYILEGVEDGPYPLFDPTSPSISRGLSEYYLKVAMRFNALFLDASEIAKASPVDCLHLDEESHLNIAEATATLINEYFK